MESEGNEESEVRRRRRSFVDLRLKGRDGRVKSVKGERVKGRRQRGRRKERAKDRFLCQCVECVCESNT